MNILKCRFLAVSLFALVAIAPLSSAATWYVDDSHTSGTHDGTSWATAFQYLQDALDASNSLDTIKTAQGIYYPDDATSGHTGNRADN